MIRSPVNPKTAGRNLVSPTELASEKARKEFVAKHASASPPMAWRRFRFRGNLDFFEGGSRCPRRWPGPESTMNAIHDDNEHEHLFPRLLQLRHPDVSCNLLQAENDLVSDDSQSRKARVRVPGGKSRTVEGIYLKGRRYRALRNAIQPLSPDASELVSIG
jgi:hypothetical protein